MKFACIIALLISPLLLASRQKGNSTEQLAISIAAEKTSVNPGDDLWIKVRLANNSNQDVSTSGTLSELTGADSNFSFEMRDANGKPVARRRYKHPELAGGKAIIGRTLKAGDSFTEDQNLSRLFDLSTPGTYTVSAVWHVREDMTKDTATREIKSNELTVTIQPKTDQQSPQG